MDFQKVISDKKPKDRSPSYPGIDIEKALERAENMRKNVGKNAVPVEVILKHWGYSNNSGPGRIAIAALKKYGLTEESNRGKERRIKLSELALRILLDERENSLERMSAIKQAALSPKIHQELWSEYNGELPSDEALRFKLRGEKNFTDSASDEFIRQFRRTIFFAKLTASDNMSSHEEDKNDFQRSDAMASMTDTQNQEKQSPSVKFIELPIMISTTKSGKIQLPSPLTEDEWTRLKAILTAYKVVYVPTFVPPEPTENPPKKDGATNEQKS